jgi:hypothetical protein
MQDVTRVLVDLVLCGVILGGDPDLPSLHDLRDGVEVVLRLDSICPLAKRAQHLRAADSNGRHVIVLCKLGRDKMFEKRSTLSLLKESIISHVDAFSRMPLVTAKGWAAHDTAFCRSSSSRVSSRVIIGLIVFSMPYASTWLLLLLSIVIFFAA